MVANREIRSRRNYSLHDSSRQQLAGWLTIIKSLPDFSNLNGSCSWKSCLIINKSLHDHQGDSTMLPADGWSYYFSQSPIRMSTMPYQVGPDPTSTYMHGHELVRLWLVVHLYSVKVYGVQGIGQIEGNKLQFYDHMYVDNAQPNPSLRLLKYYQTLISREPTVIISVYPAGWARTCWCLCCSPPDAASRSSPFPARTVEGKSVRVFPSFFILTQSNVSPRLSGDQPSWRQLSCRFGILAMFLVNRIKDRV